MTDPSPLQDKTDRYERCPKCDYNGADVDGNVCKNCEATTVVPRNIVCSMCVRGLFIGGHHHSWSETSDDKSTWRIW